jgi:hypothetical protein
MSTANGNAAPRAEFLHLFGLWSIPGKIGPTYSPTVIAAHRAKR